MPNPQSIPSPTPAEGPGSPPHRPAPPALGGSARVRIAVSVCLSLLLATMAASVLAVQTFLPGFDSDEPTPAGALMRLFERTSSGWLIPPILALLLVSGLPRRRELHALPAVLGTVTIVLILLCHLMPRLAEAGARLGSIL